MFCRNCGNELNASQQFCTNCGTRLGEVKNAADTAKTENNKVCCSVCGKELNERQQFCPDCGGQAVQKSNAVPVTEPMASKVYCKACGSELNENQQFCNSCGTQRGSMGNSVNSRAAYAGNISGGTKENLLNGWSALGQGKLWLLINIALLVLSWIFAVAEAIEAEGYGYSRSTNMYGSSVEYQFFFVLMYIASAVCMVLPLFLGKEWKNIYFLPTKITTIVATLWGALAAYSVIDNAETVARQTGLQVEAGLTVTGWLYFIANIGALILSFKTAAEIRNTVNTTSYR